jgi:septum formation protein
MSGFTVTLASASPRRRELLTLIGIAHRVRPADVDETIHPSEAPAVYAERLAREKAEAVAANDDAEITIGADTIVVIDDLVLGKPRDRTEAAAMLRTLSGRTHTVYTAVAVRRGAHMVSAVEHVAVTFRPLTDAAIASYIETGEPMDKAGAYGIQGFGATVVHRIDGDYFAVMGLALGTLVALLEQVGVRYDFGRLS